MLAIREQGDYAYAITGYFDDMSECAICIAYGLEEAIETARVEWCEGQTMAMIHDAESMVALVEIDRDGSIYLAGTAWEIEIA